MYKHILFDVDGTLFDTEEAVILSLQRAMEAFGLEPKDRTQLQFALGIPGMRALEQLEVAEADKPRFFEIWEHSLQHEFDDRVRVFDGIEGLLDLLRCRGLQLGIVTSRTRRELGIDLERFGLAGYFGACICMEDTERHKPDPEPMHAYLERVDAAPGEVLFVGDTQYDEQCAHGAGVDFALAAWGAPTVCGISAEYFPQIPLDVLNILSASGGLL
ncbi:MAG: HAD family hydrolase [Oscillospiraceae bacterium]